MIDKDNLDEECIRLPSEYEEWSTIEEKASSAYDVLVTKRAVTKAAASLELRGKPLKYINKIFNLNLDKLTEQAYKDLVYMHQDVVEITQQRDEVAEMLHIAKAKRQAIEKKKAMLDYLTTLHGQGYFMKTGTKAFKAGVTSGMRERMEKVINEKLIARKLSKQSKGRIKV
jgi:hypothetical protein